MSNDGYSSPAAPTAGDRTVMVPTPGAAAPASPAPFPAGEPAADINIRNSLNPLIGAASKLLAAVIKLRTTLNHSNVPDLHKRLTREIQSFERDAKRISLQPETVLTARYLLCTVVDEVVLSTPWGASSGWSQHSLLSLFHKETFGGEKCFLILQRTLETPGVHIDLLELFYLCLSLGFQGKFRLAPRGHEQLEQIRDNLYRTIESHRPQMERDLSPHWEGCVNRKNRLIHYVPLWVIASVVMGLLAVSFSGYRWWLYQSATPIATEINALQVKDQVTAGQQH
ncbi:type IVB secretion system protein IcmH/DotU [Microbulbifer sp. SA54]|uniref:type IVB secretion system protein IcmH/DotU n=1 Tax=Microbulbifer sp. SA54 TaxID=3401577 RepID=UPI003AAFA89E